MKNVKRKIKIETESGEEEFEVETELEIEDELEGEDGEVNAVLSNGRKAKIKFLPDAASEIALERLRAANFTKIELKEVRHKNVPRVVYNIESNKNGKFLGVFKLKMKVEGQVDSETGEVLDVNKPWWAFLVAGEDSDQTGEGMDDDSTDNSGDDEEESNETETSEENETTNNSEIALN